MAELCGYSVRDAHFDKPDDIDKPVVGISIANNQWVAELFWFKRWSEPYNSNVWVNAQGKESIIPYWFPYI